MEKQQFEVGDTLTINDKKCKLIFGPYNIALNYYYEVEDEDGLVYPVNTKTMTAQTKKTRKEETQDDYNTELYHQEPDSDDWD